MEMKMKIQIEYATRFNGWNLIDSSKALTREQKDSLEELLPDVTASSCDEDGESEYYGGEFDSDLIKQINSLVEDIVGQCQVEITYDHYSS